VPSFGHQNNFTCSIKDANNYIARSQDCQRWFKKRVQTSPGSNWIFIFQNTLILQPLDFTTMQLIWRHTFCPLQFVGRRKIIRELRAPSTKQLANLTKISQFTWL
jgi:hypothetical protein